jgi:hypothetical protein
MIDVFYCKVIAESSNLGGKPIKTDLNTLHAAKFDHGYSNPPLIAIKYC